MTNEQNDNTVKILVVDDNSENLDIITKHLKSAGFRCAIAADGKTALKRAQRINPGVIVLDIKMPDIDGFEVCKQLKQHDITKDIPVIFLTALDDINNKKKAFDAGGIDYITKPIQKEELVARVSTHLENYLYKNKLEHQVKDRTHELENEISLRKQVESQLRDSLQEKEILLQEVHHRVKNNMAIIYSFLGLKEETIEDTLLKQIFIDTKQRIKTMALVHEKIYSLKNFKYINIKDYFIDTCNDILANYDTQQRNISQVIDVDSINVGLDILVPVGLIFNEIITNSIKYAFYDIKNPTITIELKKTADSTVQLRIADNGIGFDDNPAIQKSSSFGIEIIKGLVVQLSGTVTINSKKDAGTEYLIEFPLK